MANDRMFFRCKGCGQMIQFASGYSEFIIDNSESVVSRINCFFDAHAFHGASQFTPAPCFELCYESDEGFVYQKEAEGERILDKAAAFQVLDEHRRELTRQQLLTLRGQIEAGDVDGSMRGLTRIIQNGGGV